MDTTEKMYFKNNYDFDMKITNTHRHLVKALYELVSQQSFELITVTDICQKANVSRSGFYNNFEDKYHLLFFYLRQVYTQIKATLDFTEEELLLKELLQYIEEHARFFKSLFSFNSGTELIQMIESALKEGVDQFLWTRATLANEEITKTLDFQAVFLTGGISHSIYWWVLNDMPLPIDEMASMINSLIVI